MSARRERREAESSPRALLVSPIAAPSAEQASILGIAAPIRWSASAIDGAERSTVGEGWFARHVGSPRSALLSLVVDPSFARTGLARLILETLVLGAMEQGIEQLYALLPGDGEEYRPTLERLRASARPGARGALMARIELAGPNRQLHASAPRAPLRVAG